MRLCWHSLATLLDPLFYCLTTKKLTSHTRQRIGTFGHVDAVKTARRSSKRASEWGRKQKWHWRRWTWCKQQQTAELLGCSRTTVSRACGEEENIHCENKALFMLGVRGQSGRLVGDHSKATGLPHLQHLQPWNRQCLCHFEGPWTSSSKVNTDVLCVDPTELQNYIFSCTCVDLPTAPTAHPGPPPLQHGVLQQLHFNLRSQSQGCYEVPLWKAIEPHFHLCPSCSQSISQFSFFLCRSFFGKKK